ncbi:hypothetical protein [Actinoplanes sp. GCM10030250]|uniref:hypothetical protein n=1 Tax=Actinoplanes sp. GCM10030250 TaxID=3273376 RepID=UPI0036137F95
MIALNRITRWALHAAARRWPEAVRDEMSREWHAELADLESRPGTALRQLGYAFSLLTAPPVRDAAGVPRGWGGRRAGSGTGAGAALLGMALLGTAVLKLFERFVLLPFGPALDWGWGSHLVQGLVLALWGVPLGWWLGRRAPMSRDGRFGTAGPAVLAPLMLLPALLTFSEYLMDLSPLLAAIVWAPATAVLGRSAVRAAARGRRRLTVLLAVAGVPLTALVAVALSTLPVVFWWPGGLAGGLRAAMSSLLLDMAMDLPDGVDSFSFVGGWVVLFSVYGWIAVVYGLRAAGAPAGASSAPDASSAPGALLAPDALPAAGVLPGVPVAALLAGAAAVAGGVVAWAYTVAVLTPGLPVWSADAPMPGGDGEIYLWAAELRWAGILLAAAGLVVATANRRRAVWAAVALGIGLLTAEGVLLRQEVTGAGGMRAALIAAAVVIVVSWALAGRVLRPGLPALVRRRTTTVAVVASGCGPLMYFQSTPGENHAFMPIGLPLTTALVAAAGVLLGTVTAVATSARRVHPVAGAALIGLPLIGLGVLGPYLGNGSDEISDLGVLLGLPLAVIVAAVLRRHRSRRRGLTTTLWAGLALAAVPATPVLVYGSIYLLMVVPSLLFAVDGMGYPADGISLLPAAAVLLLAMAALVLYREGGAVTTAGRSPSPDPVSASRPEPAADLELASAAGWERGGSPPA